MNGRADLRLVSPRAVLEQVAHAIPEDCRANIIIIGSLAVGYHFFGNDPSLRVHTKISTASSRPVSEHSPQARRFDLVREEIERLSSAWAKLEANETQDTLSDLLGKERLDGIDFFDQVQLASVIRVCRDSRSLSDAGRRLFSVSRGRKASTNDAHRLRKYLNRFGIGWAQIVPDHNLESKPSADEFDRRRTV
jgi:hypothetical protein